MTIFFPHCAPRATAMDTYPLLSLHIFTVLLVFLYQFLPYHSLSVETQALLEFKQQLNDPLNYLDSWIYSDSPCQFYGITCDQKTGRVIEISLDNKSLSGVISPGISALESLTSLALPSNLISGNIPPQLRSCTNLKVLNLTGNYMNGSLPDLSNLTKLEILDISGNYFSGKFPTWVGNLTSLIALGLGDNEYDEGEIPDHLGNLKNLTWLYFAGAHLRGEIPESIFQLQSLGTLDISRNKITGKFPRSISKLQNLYKIELFQNNLTGDLPLELASLSLLQEIDISSNHLSGPLPPGFDKLNLTVVQLFKNNFSGGIPAGFGDDMKYLKAISIYRNSFSGELPANLGRFSPLNSIDISENKFSGPFPRFLCASGILQFLLALNNDFSGEFPDPYAECKSLQRFRINQNRLSGTIPDGIWALPYAEIIDFSNNDFSGPISPQIGASATLNQLLLFNNRFSGELPLELGKLTQLGKLELSYNDFSGKIPIELGALQQLTSLHLEANSLTGSIPAELGQCARLVDLNLARNSIVGGIPDTFAQMSSLNSLNLSKNELTGSIPINLQKLKLSSIDLSNNKLTGEIPNQLVLMGGYLAFFGNKGLCIDESSKRIMNSGLDACNNRPGHRGLNKLVLFAIILLSLVVFLGGMLLVSYKNFKHDEGYMEKDISGEKGVSPEWKLESFHQVEFEADDVFDLDDNNLIGSGATGKVYRLDLKKGGGPVAVKQLWKGNEVKVFASEIGILGKIRHRNILKLYACLRKSGSNFLVFEYMPNGNLFDTLHREIKGGKPALDWYQRYRIALGAAKGISYLHHDCNPPIIHRDIKSTNILLDEDYEPKIADFGVAKTVELSPGGTESSGFAGTHGYIAPEMAYTLKVTEKSDVYSFGVVILELVTGRRPVEDAYGEGKDIVYWVSAHLNDRETVLNVLDPKVISKFLLDDIIKVLKIAALCTSKLPNLRPNMKDVVKMLVDAEPCIFRSPDNHDKKEKIFL